MPGLPDTKAPGTIVALGLPSLGSGMCESSGVPGGGVAVLWRRCRGTPPPSRPASPAARHGCLLCSGVGGLPLAPIPFQPWHSAPNDLEEGWRLKSISTTARKKCTGSQTERLPGCGHFTTVRPGTQQFPNGDHERRSRDAGGGHHVGTPGPPADRRSGNAPRSGHSHVSHAPNLVYPVWA